MLSLGDALAVALLEARGFTPDDFARSHPAGSLGKRLLLRVSDIMRCDDKLPVVTPDTKLRYAIVKMSEKGMGMVLVAQNSSLLGIFTDGDLRRLFQKEIDDLSEISMQDVMTNNPLTISADTLAIEALHFMENKRIHSLAVVDDKQNIKGAVSMHDLLQAGIV